MKLNVSPIADTKEFTDPWGLEVTYTVRRTGHSKAADKEVEAFVHENEQARGKSREAATARAKDAGLSTDLLSLIKNDPQFTKEIEDIASNIKEKEIYMQERMAAALLAGWKGEGFSKKELPKKGAFDADFARSVFFDSLEDDHLIIPRFRSSFGGFINHESKDYDELCEFVLAKDRDMIREQNDAKDNDSGSPERLAQIEEAHNKLYHAELKEKGFEEVPQYGETLRRAWALHIIANAAEVELSYNRARGQLQRAA